MFTSMLVTETLFSHREANNLIECHALDENKLQGLDHQHLVFHTYEVIESQLWK